MGIPQASLPQNGTSNESPVSHLVGWTDVHGEESEFPRHRGQAPSSKSSHPHSFVLHTFNESCNWVPLPQPKLHTEPGSTVSICNITL